MPARTPAAAAARGHLKQPEVRDDARVRPVVTAGALFTSAKPRRAFDEIISQIREHVLSGELQPGDRLPAERQLAEMFGVSRNTVREALRMLEISGLVTLKLGATGGAFVSRVEPARVARTLSDSLQLTDFSLLDLVEAWIWIESVVLRVACQRMTAGDLDALAANVRDAAALTAHRDWTGKALVHLEFHNLLADTCANPILSVSMRSLVDLMRDVILSVGPIQDRSMVASRSRLLRHLKERDAESAIAETERHLRRLHRLWLDGNYSGSRTTGGRARSALRRRAGAGAAAPTGAQAAVRKGTSQ